MRTLRGTLAIAIGFTLACGAMTPGEAEIDVEDCAGDADVDDTTFITWEFEESVHEMITCGSLTFQLLFALLDTAQDLFSNPGSAPDALDFSGGVYTATGTGVVMNIMFLYGSGTPGGSEGDLITADLFDPESYLEGAEVTEDGDTVTVSFDEPGPLAALLGRGDDPDSPQTFTDDDVETIAENLGSLQIDSVIYVDHEQDFSTIIYQIESPEETVADMLLSSEMDMKMISATGVRPDLTQELEPTVWSIDYGELHGTLDGVIEADVTGGPFDFHLEFEYLPTVVEPFVTITCLGGETGETTTTE